MDTWSTESEWDFVKTENSQFKYYLGFVGLGIRLEAPSCPLTIRTRKNEQRKEF